MTSPPITVTCPSCGSSRDFPAEKFPPQPLTITCRTCGHPFRFTQHLAAAPGKEEPRAGEGAPAMPAHDSMTEEVSATASGPSVDAASARPSSPGFAAGGQSRPQQARSSFVTVLAWVFIFLAGFATLISVLQNVMIATMFPVDKMREAMDSAQAREHMPPMFGFMFSHIRLYFASFLVVSAVTTGSAVALLKRKNWARLVFIGLMGCGIVWNVAGVVLQQVMMSSFPQLPAQAPADFRDRFEIMFTAIRVVTVIMAVGMSVLFGWIIKRLASPAIREEFVRQ